MVTSPPNGERAAANRRVREDSQFAVLVGDFEFWNQRANFGTRLNILVQFGQRAQTFLFPSERHTEPGAESREEKGEELSVHSLVRVSTARTVVD